MAQHDYTKDPTRSALREWAGVVAALIAVVAFINIGYTIILIEVFFDKKIIVPEAWGSGLISLSSAALGFLIGKQSTAFVPPGGSHHRSDSVPTTDDQ